MSPRFLWEITQGWHSVVPDSVRRELTSKANAGCARGVLNAPDPSYNPATDEMLAANYSAADHMAGKAANKRSFQEQMHLDVNPHAPLFLWPSRLDPVQKGPQLFTDILHKLVDDYRDRPLQVAVVANGPHQAHFHDIVRKFDLYSRVAVVDFDEKLSHLGYAAADFMIMPSLFEPCGLPQMISPLYGTLPIVHATGGLWDTVHHLDMDNNTGNGFRFEIYGAAGLRWAIDSALAFHAQPEAVRAAHISRIMQESAVEFSHETCARQYFDIYESMLKRPLVSRSHGPGHYNIS